jgi:hypothetical protein
MANSERGQREIIGELERRQVRAVVQWRNTSDESNRTAVLNGVTILDNQIRP